jgi:hypothetical protein
MHNSSCWTHLQHSQLAVLAHPGRELRLLLLSGIRKVVAAAGGLVEGPVGLQPAAAAAAEEAE